MTVDKPSLKSCHLFKHPHFLSESAFKSSMRIYIVGPNTLKPLKIYTLKQKKAYAEHLTTIMLVIDNNYSVGFSNLSIPDKIQKYFFWISLNYQLFANQICTRTFLCDPNVLFNLFDITHYSHFLPKSRLFVYF